MNVTVYLSSKSGVNKAFEQAVVDFGNAIGGNGWNLVYGGSNAGQMHKLAEAAKSSGARITGIIPEVFRKLSDSLADEMIYTQNLSERKAKLYELGDVYVALPGGIGTLDEIMSTLAEMTVNKNFSKKIILVNIDGIFDDLMSILDKFVNTKLADPRAVGCVISCETVEETIKIINTINI